MDGGNLYPGGTGQTPGGEQPENPKPAAQQGIYKEGPCQQRGEYRDPEQDFLKSPYHEGAAGQMHQVAYQPQHQPESQGFGIASLALGIASFVLFCTCINIPLAILAIIFGIIQLANPGSKKGMAIAGIVMSAISLLLLAVFLVGIWGSADFKQGFQEELRRSIERQLEDGMDTF